MATHLPLLLAVISDSKRLKSDQTPLTHLWTPTFLSPGTPVPALVIADLVLVFILH